MAQYLEEIKQWIRMLWWWRWCIRNVEAGTMIRGRRKAWSSPLQALDEDVSVHATPCRGQRAPPLTTFVLQWCSLLWVRTPPPMLLWGVCAVTREVMSLQLRRIWSLQSRRPSSSGSRSSRRKGTAWRYLRLRVPSSPRDAHLATMTRLQGILRCLLLAAVAVAATEAKTEDQSSYIVHVAHAHAPRVTSPAGVRVTVKPQKLQFSATQQKQEYVIAFATQGVGSVTEKYSFGSIVWSDGVHNVTSPIAITWPACQATAM
ncbi:hypothetical protein EJB05_50749, partial [Eragrostis curvula]